jgi:hypothetical protein
MHLIPQIDEAHHNNRILMWRTDFLRRSFITVASIRQMLYIDDQRLNRRLKVSGFTTFQTVLLELEIR